MRIYAYVDGESHYERSAALWKKLHGAEAGLTDIETPNPERDSTCSYPDVNTPTIRVIHRSKFFWDASYPLLLPYPFSRQVIDRAMYFTSLAGDQDIYHSACVEIRKHRFEPQIVLEVKQLAARRTHTVANFSIVEKAKGVDISLAAQILEDAYHNNFEGCFFFTSDIDFLPVIRVLRRLGKRVFLFGYSDGLGTRSELEYVPDVFVDLTGLMKYRYEYKGKIAGDSGP